MTATIRLGVNIDHVATLRQARGTFYPDVVAAAQLCLDSGADSITVHLREDRRHIQDNDVERLLAMDGLPLNLEMAVTDEMLGIAQHLQPRDACFVPEHRAELTTEGGLDVVAQPRRIGQACKQLQSVGIRVALFIDPDAAQVDAAAGSGAHAVEIHTGAYANARAAQDKADELARVRAAFEQAHAAGLEVHAGHGLHAGNVGQIAAMPHLVEFNIGHALVARAVFVGLPQAIDEVRTRMREART